MPGPGVTEANEVRGAGAGTSTDLAKPGRLAVPGQKAFVKVCLDDLFSRLSGLKTPVGLGIIEPASLDTSLPPRYRRVRLRDDWRLGDGRRGCGIHRLTGLKSLMPSWRN